MDAWYDQSGLTLETGTAAGTYLRDPVSGRTRTLEGGYWLAAGQVAWMRVAPGLDKAAWGWGRKVGTSTA